MRRWRRRRLRFAVGAQLDLAALAKLLDKAYRPGDCIGVGLQFVAVGEVFEFGVEAVQDACGRDFDTDEERNVIAALGVFGLDGVCDLQVFAVAGGNVGDFTVDTQVL